MLDQGLTTRQVMEMLNVRDPDTIYALRHSGKIRGQQLGRVWRFSRASVEAFLSGAVTVPPSPLPRRRHVALRLPAVPSRY